MKNIHERSSLHGGSYSIEGNIANGNYCWLLRPRCDVTPASTRRDTILLICWLTHAIFY